MNEFVDYLVSQLVGEDGDFVIEVREGASSTDIVVEVAKRDIGKVIGKQGRIAKAIRTLVKSATPRGGIRYNVVIEEKAE
ncbi:MAG TPA: KH domain-containing protein [Clostridia bacterium]|nr:KH domain-containing protein [Clostridia bacterium]